MIKKDLIKAELGKLAERNGNLSPHDVVAYARNPKTALHECFDWNDGEAADKWRLHQARMLIRVVVNVIPIDNEEREYRMFVSLKSDRYAGVGYRPLILILNDENLKAQMLTEALEELQIFKEKYKDLKELCEVFEAVEKVMMKIPRRRVEEKRLSARV